MLRKVLIFFTLLLIAFIGYFSYKLLRDNEVAVNSLIDAIPVDASLIIEINRPELLFDIIYSPPIDAGSFLSIPFIKDPLEKLKTIDSVASQNKLVKSVIRRPHAALISGHQVGKDELEMIFYLKLNSEVEFESIQKIIRQNIQGKGNISYHNYDDARIYDVIISNRRSGGFSFAFYRGMLVISKSSILIEEVIRQSKTGTSILSKAGLGTVMKTAGKSSPFNIYINFDYFPSLALNFIHSRFRKELEAISKFAHWIELDFNIDNNAIVLNGFSSAENTNGFLSDIFKDQEPFNLLLPGLLPSGTKSFFAIGISDYSKFRLNFSEYQKNNLTNPDFEKNLQAFKQSFGTNLDTEFIKAFDNEVCFTFYPGSSENLQPNIFTVIKTKGNSEARQFLNQISTAVEKRKTDSLEINLTIYNTSSFNIPKLLFGNIFAMNNNSYCTITENYLIFGDSLTHLNAFAREFSQLKNLSLELNYRGLSELLSEDTYCYFYLSPQAEQLYRHYMKYTSDQMFSQYRYGLSQVQAIVYQFGRNNDLFYNNAFIRFSSKPKGNVNKMWEVQLENSLSSKITPVKNHINNAGEIICQDKSNNLYLISQNGEILWKRKLDSRILGEIYQIDLFTNKKLQYIFNTATHIMAIDRNGKDVEGFPVKLASAALAGMALFDYDKNRNYRILIPLSDKKIHCFDKTGKKVDGWLKPEIGSKPLKIAYFASNGKDFIVVADENELQFFDRRGKVRITPSQKIRIAPNSEIFGYFNKSTYQFECTDSSGTINFIALNGNVSKVQTGIYPSNHYYLSVDIDFNKTRDHLFFYGRKFEAFTSTGARISNYPLNGEVTRQPKLINLNDSAFLFTYTDTFSNKIFIENNLGNSLKDTPLTGNSEISFQLVESSKQGINLYYGNNNILYCIFVK